jgi:hypothetical protein
MSGLETVFIKKNPEDHEFEPRLGRNSFVQNKV